MRPGALALAAGLALRCAPAPAFVGSEAGASGAAFLELPASARAAAMGSAHDAAASDAAALHYNPACLAAVRGGAAVVTHASQLAGARYQYGAAAQRLGTAGTLAVGVLTLSQPPLEERDNTGAASGKTFTPQDLAVSIGLGRPLDRLDLGASVKLVSSRIASSAQTAAADLGARLRLGAAALSGSLSNLGSGLRWRERSAPLPLTLRGGASLALDRAVVAADLVLARSGPAVGGGAEYAVIAAGIRGFLRAGYDSPLGGHAGVAGGLSLGAGLSLGGLSFDYAWKPAGTLGDSHRLSVGAAWR